jgi:hypothetical protein
MRSAEKATRTMKLVPFELEKWLAKHRSFSQYDLGLFAYMSL